MTGYIDLTMHMRWIGGLALRLSDRGKTAELLPHLMKIIMWSKGKAQARRFKK